MSRVLLAMMFALAISAPAGAIRFDWTAEELRCAQTVGVDLVGDPEPGSSDYVKRLAWLADLIVYGKVTKIRRDKRGSYPTSVRIDVLSVRKGRLPKGPLTVALMSAPSHEPSFARGETVLLFLTKGTPEDSYRLVNAAKFRIDGVDATLQGLGSGDYNVVRSEYEIRQVVEAQSTNCDRND